MYYLIFTEAPAEFLQPLVDQSVMEKETAEFSCEISKANLKVKWLKGEQEVKSDKRHSMTCMANKYMLVIKDSELDDQADYTIVAEEGVTSTAKLAVQGTDRSEHIVIDLISKYIL